MNRHASWGPSQAKRQLAAIHFIDGKRDVTLSQPMLIELKLDQGVILVHSVSH